ncbi:MAG: hypothetical protein CYPHOPRED_002109 [Cyphobasidiales sp. Tagirdzhanova-0007]|nr:MAG: hypothetical protein CYPHOPRED_002109 [Cyphobasidiales sp. Tagirdzhanova-0007]
MSSSANSWLFDDEDFQHTPSRADGITYERETYERAYGVDLIVRVGSVRINVPVLTVATAALFLQRFYMVESLAQYGAREVAMACLFLAGKVEESLRKVEAVVNYCLRLEDRRKGKEPDIHPSSESFKRLVQQVLYIEEVILVALQFDLTVVHPHPLLSRALNGHANELSHSQITSLGRCAWQIMSDMYTTILCVSYSTSTLAAACFLLAWQTVDILPSLPENWKEPFELDGTNENAHDIDRIVQIMTDFWARARSGPLQESGRMLQQITPKIASQMPEPDLIKESQNKGAVDDPEQGAFDCPDIEVSY